MSSGPASTGSGSRRTIPRFRNGPTLPWSGSPGSAGRSADQARLSESRMPSRVIGPSVPDFRSNAIDRFATISTSDDEPTRRTERSSMRAAHTNHVDWFASPIHWLPTDNPRTSGLTAVVLSSDSNEVAAGRKAAMEYAMVPMEWSSVVVVTPLMVGGAMRGSQDGTPGRRSRYEVVRVIGTGGTLGVQ